MFGWLAPNEIRSTALELDSGMSERRTNAQVRDEDLIDIIWMGCLLLYYQSCDFGVSPRDGDRAGNV